MKNLISDITQAANVADGYFESGEERQTTLTVRHQNDMNSDSWLSKAIRPLTLLVLLVLQIVIILLSAFGFTIDWTVLSQHGALLAGAFGFYFSSRKAEKVAAQNAKANIEIKKLETRAEIKEERKANRAERRAARKERRAERQQDKTD